jgi:hypothetical protein
MSSLILCVLLFGQSIQFKPEYNFKSNEFVIIKPDVAPDNIKYVPLTEGLNRLDAGLLKDKKDFVAIAPKGKYKVLVYGSIDNNPTDPIFFVINVGEDDSPKPIPNELESIINATYGADNNPNKSQYKSKLITGFTSVLDGLVGCKTVGDLNKLMKDKVTSKLVDGEGGAVRSVLRDHLSDTFGINGDVILNDELATKVILNILNILKRL